MNNSTWEGQWERTKNAFSSSVMCASTYAKGNHMYKIYIFVEKYISRKISVISIYAYIF